MKVDRKWIGLAWAEDAIAVNSTLGFTARASLTVEWQNELRQSHVTLTTNCRYLLRVQDICKGSNYDVLYRNGWKDIAEDI